MAVLRAEQVFGQVNESAAVGDLLGLTPPGHGEHAMEYDGAGRMERYRTPTGVSPQMQWEWSYNGLGQLITQGLNGSNVAVLSDDTPDARHPRRRGA